MNPEQKKAHEKWTMEGTSRTRGMGDPISMLLQVIRLSRIPSPGGFYQRNRRAVAGDPGDVYRDAIQKETRLPLKCAR